MNDPRNFYKKNPITDYLGSIQPKSQSIIPDETLLTISQEFKNKYSGLGDLLLHKTDNNLTAAEYSLREEQRLQQWKREEHTRRYNRNQQKLLTTLKGMLKDFEGYQLLLQSDSYRQLQESVQEENVPEEVPEVTSATKAYLDALRYGLGRMKSP